ncbi:MAG TPA: iron-sulfur cluster assembly protein [Cyclobacteriaceae bacterium]|nr:iron-sulfur cluster assembly protein [Cyclobacteriaceae bacterium]
MPNAWIESDNDALAEDVVNCIKLVYDPEIPLNVYDLGLIYRIEIAQSEVLVTMTLTNPACPSGSEIAGAVKRAIELIESIKSVQIKLTFDPPYSSDMMSEAAKLELGFL